MKTLKFDAQTVKAKQKSSRSAEPHIESPKHTRLRFAPHTVTAGETKYEIWFGTKLIGTVVGKKNGSGVQIITKHPVTTAQTEQSLEGIAHKFNVVTVNIKLPDAS